MRQPTLLIALALLACCSCPTCAKDETDSSVVEPPFPKLFSRLSQGQNKVKIVSEIIGDDVGYQTSEEYLDLKAGKAAFVVRKLDLSQQVAYTDVRFPLTYKYTPYVCQTLEPKESVFATLDDFVAHLSLESQEGQASLRIFGAAALWLMVESRSKRYSQSDLVFSASKDIYRPSHNWEIKMSERDLVITFYFIDANYNAVQKKPQPDSDDKKEQLEPDLNLEMIQIKSLASNKILRTMNILMIDYQLEESVYSSLLQVPLGYGCPTSGSTGDDYLDAKLNGADLTLERSLVELEITKTSIDYDKRRQADVRSTKTVNIQTYVSPSSPVFLVSSLIRIRDEEKDLKIVDRHRYRVKYVVDLKRGTCKMVHDASDDIETPAGAPASATYADDELIYAFDGDVNELPINRKMLNFLLHHHVDYRFIKRTRANSMRMEHLYLERSFSWPIDLNEESGKTHPPAEAQVQQNHKLLARVIRNYVVVDNSDVRLESVTIWVFDKTQARIVESYHFNVLSQQPIDEYGQEAQLLDVSEECYLNNPEMRPGRDYAWIEVSYPVASREVDQLAMREATLKRDFYEVFGRNPNINMWPMTMPRVEILFNDEGLVVRALLLDVPPLELVYQPFEGKSIKLRKESGDLLDMAPDVRHCARLCRLHQCEAMTFCGGARSCLLGLGLGQPEDQPEQKPMQRYGADMIAMQNCQSYIAPFRYGQSFMASEDLRHVLSYLSHEDYTSAVVPRAPDEIVLPREETGVDEEAYERTLESYRSEIQAFVKNNVLPTLTLMIFMEQRTTVLAPNKFVLEKDPLDQFNQFEHEAADALNADDMKADAFHEGISMNRFKVTTFPEELAQRARQFDGVTYDQCALACLDGRCGSFSYCSNRQECIITSINSTRLAHEFNLIQQDLDCFISQRDFLKNFNKFPAVYRPQFFKKQSTAVSPSDCALECVAESDFRCMSFEFCADKAAASPRGACFYQTDRHPAGIYEGAQTKRGAKSRTIPTNAADMGACDHYERSLLADFNQVEYREIQPAQLDKLKTTSYEGMSLFDCADTCVSQLTDCTAFQFCFGWQRVSMFSDSGGQSIQNCTMIRSRPSSNEDNFAAVIDEKADGKLVKTGGFIQTSKTCHLFTLRHDTSEAHLRDLAFSQTMTLAEQAELEAIDRQTSAGLSLFGCFMLFVSVTAVSMAIGFGICVAKEHNEYVRQRVERARILLGL